MELSCENIALFVDFISSHWPAAGDAMTTALYFVQTFQSVLFGDAVGDRVPHRNEHSRHDCLSYAMTDACGDDG